MTARECFSVKINAKIKKDFTDRVKETKLSTCLVVEALLIAWTEGSKYLPPAQSKPNSLAGHTITVNQNFPRVVKRERRKSGVTVFKPEDNCYKNTMWTYRRPEKGELLSAIGHVLECECSVCKPFVARLPCNRRESGLW